MTSRSLIVITGQQTPTVIDYVVNIKTRGDFNEDGNVITSKPGFNTIKDAKQYFQKLAEKDGTTFDTERWNRAEKLLTTLKPLDFNEPIFGNETTRLALLVNNMLEILRISETQYIKLTIPDDCVKEATEKFNNHIKPELEKRGLNELVAKVSSFLAGVLAVKSTFTNDQSDLDKWNNYLRMHGISSQNEMKLDLANYLQNFDPSLTLETLKSINDSSYFNEKGVEKKIGDGCVRWLSKVIYSPDGCVTDVGNMLKFLRTNYLRAFGKSVTLINDSELDDVFTVVIFKVLYALGFFSNLNIVVQFPPVEANNDMAEKAINNMLYRIDGNTLSFDQSNELLKLIFAEHYNEVNQMLQSVGRNTGITDVEYFHDEYSRNETKVRKLVNNIQLCTASSVCAQYA
jgi:hypothetical protein